MTLVWVIGNGGHAKVVIDALKTKGRYSLAGILSDDPSLPPVEPGIDHVGPIDRETIKSNSVQAAIIAIGNNVARQRIASRLDGHVEWISIMHPGAIVAQSATVGEGVLLSAGSIVQPFVTIDDHAIVNTAASVDHDSIIGAFAHIAPGCHLAGNVSVGEGALIGVGASVIPGISIGANSTVGAGSVVIHDVPDGATVAGNPARELH